MAFTKPTILPLIFAAFIICFCSFSSLAELQRFQQPLKSDGSLSFLVIGDWGRRGLFNQSEVASQMGVIGEELDIDFVISTGDNFYEDGLTGIDDPNFYESFTNIYTAPSLQKQWYSVLGNHDYRGDVEAQLNPILTQKDNRWLCMRSFIVNAEIVEIFFVDTSPFVNDYFTNPEHNYDWKGISPRETYLANLLKDVDAALSSSTAKWKFVVGHHAILSAGHHGITVELLQQLVPIINGHDHCIQHISSSHSNIQFITSGGGSKAWRGDIRKWDPEELKLYYDGQGFMSVQMTDSTSAFAFYDAYGSVLHQWSISKESHSAFSFC